jgi:hypothetical protein
MRDSLRCAACVIVAAFAALLSLASPAIAGETGLDHPPGEPALWPAADLLDSLQRAQATVPSERALDAWQRYAMAWRDASDAIGPERARVQRAGQQRGYRVYESDDWYAARKALDRHALDVEEQLEAALLSSLAETSSPEGQAAIESVRRERRLGRVMAQARTLASGTAFETLHLETLLVDALRRRPADCAAALAALERTRDERIAAATAVVEAAAAGERAERAFCVSSGLDLLTSADWMAINLRRQERAETGDSAAAPDSASTATPAHAVDAAQAAADDRVLAAFGQAGQIRVRPTQRARAALHEAQWKSLHAAVDAVGPEARLVIARAAWRFVGDFVGMRPAAMGIIVSMCQPGIDPACAACLRAALPTWRREWPELFLRTGDTAIRAAAAALRRGSDADSQDSDDDGLDGYSQALSAWEEQLATESAALERRVCAACASGCLRDPDDESIVHGSIAAARDLPEVADDTESWEDLGFTLDDRAPDAADDAAMEANPFGLGNAGEPTIVGLPIDADWLRAALRNRGLDADALAVCQPILDHAAAQWETSVLPVVREVEELLDAPLLTYDGGPFAFDEARASRIPSVIARARDAARAADAEAVSALVAALGLGPDDASMLRLARGLGEQRRERESFFAGESTFDGLRVNVASAVLATALSADARAAAIAVALRRGPELESKLAEFRRVIMDSHFARFRARARMEQERADPANRSAFDRIMRAYREEAVAQQLRSVAARRAVDAAERAAIDAIIAAIPPDDALAFRGTVNRRRYPDVLFGHEMFLKVVANLLGRLPVEDEAARIRLARTADAWVAASNENMALELERRETTTRANADRAAGKAKTSDDAAHLEGINACHHLRYALLSLAVERLADACAADLLRESEEFNALMRQYCDGAMSRSDSAMKSLLRRHGLDSAP